MSDTWVINNSGHVGRNGEALKALPLQRSYWPPVARYIPGFIYKAVCIVICQKRVCALCQRSKASNRKKLLKAGLLEQLPVPSEIWRSVCVEFIMHMPMPKTAAGYTYDDIMVLVDRLSK